MGNAKRRNGSSAETSGKTLGKILGLSAILLSFAAADAGAAGCSAEIQRDEAGAYAGCTVRVGQREYSVGREQSSENGCAQVCGILAEVGGSRGRSQKLSKASLSQ